VSAPQKPDTPGKGLARALELDLDLEEVDAIARRQHGAEEAHETDGDRPTVAPPYDVTEFARAATSTPPPRPPPPLPTAAQNSPSIVPMRGPSQTLTDEAELEDARKRSVHTSPPGTTSIIPPTPETPVAPPPDERGATAGSELPPSRAVTAPPKAAVAGSPSSEAETVKRQSTARQPARASGNLLMLADARLQSLVPPANNPGNAWSTIDRGWSAEDDEAPTDESETMAPTASEIPEARPTTPALDESGESGESPLPPASGRTGTLGSEPPPAKRSPTLRPGAHTAPTPPAHKPFVTRRATRVWTSDTTSVMPGALSPSAPPPSSSGAGDRDDAAAASAVVASSVSPPGERSPQVGGSTLEERVERALSYRPEAFDDDTAARERKRETPYPGGRQTRDLEAPKITPLAVPRLGMSDEDLTLIKSGRGSSVPPTRKAETEPTQEMRERFSLGDYTGALVIAEGILEDTPEAPAATEAREYAESCRSVLQQMYTARIGPLERVPVVMVPRDQLRWLSIDHRAGFVLSHVDGISSLEMILDVSGMPSLDTLRILCELSQQRIISFR
jgi:hypothetical protein